MPEAKPIMIFHCRRHLYFPLPLLLQNLRLPFIDVSCKSLSQFPYVDSGRKNDFRDTAKRIKSLGISTFLMNQCHFYTSCKSDKIIVLLQTEFINFHHYTILPWDIILQG
jgi:hypothetical protein